MVKKRKLIITFGYIQASYDTESCIELILWYTLPRSPKKQVNHMKTQGLVNGQRLLYREKKNMIKEKPEACINGGFNRIVKTGGEGCMGMKRITEVTTIRTIIIWQVKLTHGTKANRPSK